MVLKTQVFGKILINIDFICKVGVSLPEFLMYRNLVSILENINMKGLYLFMCLFVCACMCV